MSNLANLNTDKISGDKIVVSDYLGCVYSHDKHKAVFLFIKLINSGGKDYLDLWYHRINFKISHGDKIGIILENGYKMEYEVDSEPYADGDGMYRTSFQIYAADLQLLKESNIDKIIIENLKLNKISSYSIRATAQMELLKGETWETSSIPSSLVASHYFDLVGLEIEDYKPLEHQVRKELLKENNEQHSYEEHFMYLLSDPINNLFKIENSNEPQIRESQYKVDNPHIKIIAIKRFPNGKLAANINMALQITYSETRAKGDWLDLSWQDIENLKMIME